MSNLLLIAICLTLGVTLRRTGLFPETTPRALNAWVLYVALPALVISKLHGVRLTAEAALPASMAWLEIALVVGLVHGIGAMAGWTRETRAGVMLTAGLANTSFVGLPLIEALVGPEGLPTAILCDQLGSFVVVSTVGMAVAGWGSGERPSASALAARILRFPSVWAMFGVLAFGDLVPDVLLGALDRLGGTLTPLAIASVGFQLTLTGGGDGLALGVGLFLKLIVAPAALLAFYLALGVPPGLGLTVTTLEAAMAPMITGAILAADAGLAPQLVARMVGIGIPLSMLTVPAWAWALARIG